MKPAVWLSMTLDLSWQNPITYPALAANDVHIWRAALKQPDADFERLIKVLSDSEMTRANRFHFDHHRRSFIIGRGILRLILAGYLNCSPAGIDFQYGPQNKPALPEATPQGVLNFNLSHSHDQALYAFSYNRELGVDIERIRTVPHAEGIAKRFFSSRENAVFEALPPNQKDEGFFNCWTRKEAYIKALGDGLTHPLDTFEVSLAPQEPARLLRVEGDPSELSRWTMRSLTPRPGYVAALIVDGNDWQMKSWEWQNSIQGPT